MPTPASATMMLGVALLFVTGLAKRGADAGRPSHDEDASLLQAHVRVADPPAMHRSSVDPAAGELARQTTAALIAGGGDNATRAVEATLADLIETSFETSYGYSFSKAWREKNFGTDDDIAALAVDGRHGHMWKWGALALTCATLYLADMVVLQRAKRSLGAHLALVAFWLLVARAFDMFLRVNAGSQAAAGWWPAYLMEWALSSDDQFAFYAIHRKYRTPRDQVHYSMFVGLPLGIPLRFGLYMSVATLLKCFGWLRVVFGVLLVLGGLQTLCGGSEEIEENEDETPWVAWALRSVLGDRSAAEFGATPSLVQRGADGKLQVLPMLLVMVTVELTAVVCALDSTRAKLMEFPDLFVAFSSAAIATFGIRSFFLVFEDVVETFSVLRYIVAVFLVYMGAQIVFVQYLRLPYPVLLIVVVALVGAALITQVIPRVQRYIGKPGDILREQES